MVVRDLYPENILLSGDSPPQPRTTHLGVMRALLGTESEPAREGRVG